MSKQLLALLNYISFSIMIAINDIVQFQKIQTSTIFCMMLIVILVVNVDTNNWVQYYHWQIVTLLILLIIIIIIMIVSIIYICMWMYICIYICLCLYIYLCMSMHPCTIYITSCRLPCIILWMKKKNAYSNEAHL